MLTESEQKAILQELPDIKLSYENITHKKVYNFDFLVAIPDGKKCLAWFTEWNGNGICIVLEISYENANKQEFSYNAGMRRRQIKNMKIMNCCFSKTLCYGTIFYGTLFHHMHNSFFSIEDVLWYKGTEIIKENWKTKLERMINILKTEIHQVSYNNNFVVFGLPVIAKTNEELDAILQTDIKYKIHSVQYRNFNSVNSASKISYEEYLQPQVEVQEVVESQARMPKQAAIPVFNEKMATDVFGEAIFQVKPDVQNDVYYLYCSKNLYYDIANIPDYKTSVMMNKLFRNIKENADLDRLEESDDEEEFENCNIDKFVYLERSFKMRCVFNKRFKKWTPIETVDDNHDVVLSNIEYVVDVVNKCAAKTYNYNNNNYNNNKNNNYNNNKNNHFKNHPYKKNANKKNTNNNNTNRHKNNANAHRNYGTK